MGANIRSGQRKNLEKKICRKVQDTRDTREPVKIVFSSFLSCLFVRFAGLPNQINNNIFCCLLRMLVLISVAMWCQWSDRALTVSIEIIWSPFVFSRFLLLNFCFFYSEKTRKKRVDDSNWMISDLIFYFIFFRVFFGVSLRINSLVVFH